MPKSILILPLCAVLWAAPGQAVAQMGDTRPPTAPGPTVPPPAVPDMRPGETLSDQMQRHNGVIPPTRDVDPDMHVPAPDTGTTPVIPPPAVGESIQPK